MGEDGDLFETVLFPLHRKENIDLVRMELSRVVDLSRVDLVLGIGAPGGWVAQYMALIREYQMQQQKAQQQEAQQQTQQEAQQQQSPGAIPLVFLMDSSQNLYDNIAHFTTADTGIQLVTALTTPPPPPTTTTPIISTATSTTTTTTTKTKTSVATRVLPFGVNVALFSGKMHRHLPLRTASSTPPILVFGCFDADLSLSQQTCCNCSDTASRALAESGQTSSTSQSSDAVQFVDMLEYV
jgi:hypothetical protein